MLDTAMVANVTDSSASVISAPFSKLIFHHRLRVAVCSCHQALIKKNNCRQMVNTVMVTYVSPFPPKGNTEMKNARVSGRRTQKEMIQAGWYCFGVRRCLMMLN